MHRKYIKENLNATLLDSIKECNSTENIFPYDRIWQIVLIVNYPYIFLFEIHLSCRYSQYMWWVFTTKPLRICPERNLQVSLFNSKFVHMNWIVLTNRCWVRSALSYDVGLNSYIWGRQPLVWSWFGVDFSGLGFLTWDFLFFLIISGRSLHLCTWRTSRTLGLLGRCSWFWHVYGALQGAPLFQVIPPGV